MTKRDRRAREISRHGADLNAIFATDTPNEALCRRLRKIEARAHRLAEAYCNGVVDALGAEMQKAKILASVDKILGFKAKDIPVFLNMDPRGYALKIRSAYVEQHGLKIHRDWGGYGILAPEF